MSEPVTVDEAVEELTKHDIQQALINKAQRKDACATVFLKIDGAERNGNECKYRKEAFEARRMARRLE